MTNKVQSKLSRYMQFALVVLAAGAIFPLLYLRGTYAPTLAAALNVSAGDLETLNFWLGVVFIVGYFPSGFLADKISPKWLLTISLLGTGLVGIWYSLMPNFGSVVVIFMLWGVFSVFTFWGAHMKLVKLLATKEEEGTFFGILDGGRGAVEAILATIAAAIFVSFPAVVDSSGTEIRVDGIKAIVWMYVITLLAVGVLVALFVKNDDKKPTAILASNSQSFDSNTDSSSENAIASDNTNTFATDSASQNTVAASTAVAEDKLTAKEVLKLLKNKYVYILGGVIFMGYITYWTYYYFSSFMQANISVSSTDAAKIMVAVMWMRPIGGIVGGFLADKFGKGKVLSSVLALSAVVLFIVSSLPVDTSLGVFVTLFILAGLFMFAIRGTYWSLVGDVKGISAKNTGVIIGWVSLIGYLPDILLPIMITGLLGADYDYVGLNNGFNTYFIISGIAAIISIAFVILFVILNKKENKKLEKM